MYSDLSSEDSSHTLKGGEGGVEGRGSGKRRKFPVKYVSAVGTLRQIFVPIWEYGTVKKFFNRIQPHISTLYMISKYKIIKGKKQEHLFQS